MYGRTVDEFCALRRDDSSIAAAMAFLVGLRLLTGRVLVRQWRPPPVLLEGQQNRGLMSWAVSGHP